MEKIKVLFVDDDTNFGNIITSSLTFLGYKVNYISALIAIEGAINETDPSVLLFDIEVDDKDGIDKAGEIHQLFPYLPIIILSSHTSTPCVVRALENGCVAVIDKIADIEVIAAYINRFALRKAKIKEFGNFSLNCALKELKHTDSNELIYLSDIENKLLALLVSNIDQITSREEIINSVWGNENTNSQVVTNTISKLRTYLECDNSIKISTIKGEGYGLMITK